MKFLFLTVLAFTGYLQLCGQTGPNSPLTGTNNTGTGTIAWTNPANIVSSNNGYATVSTSGSTNYLFGTTFGFAIAGPANVDGIQLDIEKKEVSPTSVSILNTWTTGLTKTISAGTNRCLIVVAATENGENIRDITSMTYGGQAMTQVLAVTSGTTTGFSDGMEVWMLTESGISAAAGTTIVPTYAATNLVENVEAFTAITFQNVDQITPVSSSQVTPSNASTNPHQLSSAFNTLAGSMGITGVVCGNNTTPALTSGGTNTYTVNSSFVEGTDLYVSNPSFSTSGISYQTATKASAAIGTEQPTFTFAGSVNRASMFGFTLQRARGIDNSVYLLKAGSITGSNLASPTTSWPVADAYVSYGGPTNLWGTTWTLANINNVGFGAALAATRSNGNLNVDHFRITVYTTSTLPIELLEFTANTAEKEVRTKWITASETNNDYFLVERAGENQVFQPVGRIEGAGNSTRLLSYDFTDTDPLPGISYYRLKQVDFNGQFSYSAVVAVNFEPAVNAANVYPNPSADGVFTFLQEGQTEENEVAVFSSDLTLVKKASIAPGEKAMISLADQADGIYFLIYNENGTQQVKRVQKISREN